MFIYGPTKRCAKCGDTKSRDEFPKHRNRSDGLHPYCKECRRKEKLKDPEKYRAKQRRQNAKWRARNAEYHRVRDRLRRKLKERQEQPTREEVLELLALHPSLGCYFRQD